MTGTAQDLSDLYQQTWKPTRDPAAHEAFVRPRLAATRDRILRFQSVHHLPPTPASVRRLVDVEIGLADSAVAAVRRERWLRKVRFGAERITPGCRLVDCGAGFGTEAIAFALLGAQVTAVDLFPAMSWMARHRAAIYGEAFGVDLETRVATVAAHLPAYSPATLPFDLAWSNESIEHIAPLQPFFVRLHSWLRPGGVAVICNDNALNPLVGLWVAARRGSVKARYTEHPHPDTGAPVPYAREAIRTPLGTQRMLREAGFRRVDVRYVNVAPSRLGRAAGPAEWLASIPGARSVSATDYVALATA